MITCIPQNLSAEVKVSFTKKGSFEYTVVTLFLDGEEYDTAEHMITRSTRDFGWQFAYQDIVDVLHRMLGKNAAYKYDTHPSKLNAAIKERKPISFPLWCDIITVDM